MNIKAKLEKIQFTYKPFKELAEKYYDINDFCAYMEIDPQTTIEILSSLSKIGMLTIIGLDIYVAEIYKGFIIVDDHAEFIVNSNTVLQTGTIDSIEINYDNYDWDKTQFRICFNPAEHSFRGEDIIEIYIRLGQDTYEHEDYLLNSDKYDRQHPGVTPILVFRCCEFFNVLVMHPLSLIT